MRSRRAPGPAPARSWLRVVLAAIIAIGAGAAVWAFAIGPSNPSTGGGAAADPTTIGTAIGDLAPAFEIVDIEGNTITRDSLNGRPAVVWFTSSYCTPCQEGALSLGRILDRLGAAGKVAVVMIFVDPGESSEALSWWKGRFGRADWAVGFTSPEMFTDYAVQYLDTKYLLDSNGVIRAADFVTLQEGPWERDLRSVLGS